MSISKLGLIFDNQAQLPTPEDRNDNIRIYYSYRINNQSYINYFEILKKNLKVVYKNKKPVFSPGSFGCFDDVGVMPSCLVSGNLYYTGWNLRGTVPYSHAIGQAIFNENKNKFERVSLGPILDRSDKVPYLANSPFIHENKMFFCNGTGWSGNFPKYNIWYAEKQNERWVVIDHLFGHKDEACSRVCFVDNLGFIFSKKNKNKSYEIFLYNNCKFEKIIKRSKYSDWDSEMTCYPHVFGNLIFYNGNGFGKSGVGVAKYE